MPKDPKKLLALLHRYLPFKPPIFLGRCALCHQPVTSRDGVPNGPWGQPVHHRCRARQDAPRGL